METVLKTVVVQATASSNLALSAITPWVQPTGFLVIKPKTAQSGFGRHVMQLGSDGRIVRSGSGQRIMCCPTSGTPWRVSRNPLPTLRGVSASVEAER